MSDAGETASPVRLIVGLGNPGSRYDGTRHNIGFALVDRLASGAWREKGKALLAEGTVAGKAVILMKPLTYMNLSGEAVTPVAQFHKIASGEVVVAHDDIDLPLGTVRLKHGGGDGGHNGLKSVSQHIGAEYVRLRLGVGRPMAESVGASRDVADWVLARFDRSEESIVGEELTRGERAIELLMTEGLKRAQNVCNR
jgi:PTH1 family peptidyl-tRNA hydrolase